jgi:hypothetical protein
LSRGLRRCARNGTANAKPISRPEQDRDQAIAARQADEDRLGDVIGPQQAQKPSGAAPKAKLAEKANGSVAVEKPRRGRRPKAAEPEAEPEFVEWWGPGWRDRSR